MHRPNHKGRIGQTKVGEEKHVAYSLPLYVALLAGLLAIPLAAQAGPTTCPTTGAICIDESVEGAAPTVIAPSGITSSVTPVTVAVGEEWTITITSPLGGVSAASVGFQEPGSLSLSDIWIFSSSNSTSATYTLFSDNELGQMGTSCGLCFAMLTEDGTFQQLPNNFLVTSSGATLNLFLRSDVEAVPEPASLVLLGTALVGFGVIRRRRKLASAEL